MGLTPDEGGEVDSPHKKQRVCVCVCARARVCVDSEARKQGATASPLGPAMFLDKPWQSAVAAPSRRKQIILP